MRRDHLTREEIEGIVQYGDWSPQGGNRYRVYGDLQGRRVRVVLAWEGDHIAIITTFYDD